MKLYGIKELNINNSSFTLKETGKLRRSREQLSLTGYSDDYTVEPLFVQKSSFLDTLYLWISSLFTTWVETDGIVEGRGTLYLKKSDLGKKLFTLNPDKIVVLDSVLEKVRKVSWLGLPVSQIDTLLDKTRSFSAKETIQIKTDKVRGWYRDGSLYLFDKRAKLGEGTFKKVYHGVFYNTKERKAESVAISKITVDATHSNVAPTLLEDGLGKQIDSPYVVGSSKGMFVSADGRYLYMASTEYLGHADEKYIESRLGRPLTEKEKVKIALDAAKGLLAVHKKGYVHRDIKFLNILVGYDKISNTFSGVLSDLGLAIKKDEQKGPLGTWVFTPPAVQNGGLWNEKWEVYALGLFYNMFLSPKSVEGMSLVKHSPNFNWKSKTYMTYSIKIIIKKMVDGEISLEDVISQLEELHSKL